LSASLSNFFNYACLCNKSYYYQPQTLTTSGCYWRIIIKLKLKKRFKKILTNTESFGSGFRNMLSTPRLELSKVEKNKKEKITNVSGKDFYITKYLVSHFWFFSI